jgi:hypothetical protein
MSSAATSGRSRSPRRGRTLLAITPPAPQTSDVGLLRTPSRQPIPGANRAAAPRQDERAEHDEAPRQFSAFYGAPDHDGSKECQHRQFASVFLHRPSGIPYRPSGLNCSTNQQLKHCAPVASDEAARIGLSRSTGGIAVLFEVSGLALQPATEHPYRESQEDNECGGYPEGGHCTRCPTESTPCRGISVTLLTLVERVSPAGVGSQAPARRCRHLLNRRRRPRRRQQRRRCAGARA